ncbi:PilX N-terminal domain-containing pilus assembly protein [Colwelliaceae bacterium 6471]
MAISYYSGKKAQQGVVLVVSLVFLIALTAVAAALMQNTTTDMKMSGASQEKVVATQETISAADEVTYNEVSKADGENLFARPIASFGAAVAPNIYPMANVALSIADATGEVYIENPNGLEADCSHSRGASSVQVFTCNVLRIQIEKKYGRTKGNSLVVNAGISQELLR